MSPEIITVLMFTSFFLLLALGVAFEGLRRHAALGQSVPEGRAGVMELRLNAADLELPAGLAVRSITPEFIEDTIDQLLPGRYRVSSLVASAISASS